MNDWIVWQLADSAFPIGGFAHSGGLEAAWRAGQVPYQAALQGFVQSNLQQCANGIVPLSLMAFRNSQDVIEADDLCDLFLNNPVANRASRAQGRALLSMVKQICLTTELNELYSQLQASQWRGHFPVAMGAVGRILSLQEAQISRLLLLMNMRSVISAAVRLGIIGPQAGQSLQMRLGPIAEQLAEASHKISPDDIAQTSPMADLFQGCHDRLYSRLFQS